MNIILSLLFLVMIFLIYYGIGDFMTEKLNMTKDFKYSILTGFIVVNAILMVLSALGNIAHLSWKLLVIMNSVALLLGILVLARFRLKKIIQISKKDLLLYLRDHYLIILLALLCVYLTRKGDISSIYADIDGIINRGGLAPSINRIFNQSYSTICGYYASLFHIDLTFFLKGAVNFHNMFLIFLALQALISLFVENKYAQYLVLCSILFYGYIHLAGFKQAIVQGNAGIEGIDGESFIKIAGIPLTVCYGKLFLEKTSLFSTSVVLMICVFLLGCTWKSYLYVLIMILGLAFMKLADLAMDGNKITGILVIAIAILVYYAGTLRLGGYKSEITLAELNAYNIYLGNVDDLIFLHTPILIALSFIFSENRHVKEMMLILVLSNGILYTRYLDLYLIYRLRNAGNLMVYYSNLKNMVIVLGITGAFLIIKNFISKGEKV